MHSPMSRRALLVFVIVASVSLTACAGGTGSTSSEARNVHPAWLTGQWEATGWQVAGDAGQGVRATTVTFAPDGTWKTSAGGAGTSWLVGDNLFVEGATSDGYKFQFSLANRQNADGSRELYGTVAARPGASQISLKKIR